MQAAGEFGGPRLGPSAALRRPGDALLLPRRRLQHSGYAPRRLLAEEEMHHCAMPRCGGRRGGAAAAVLDPHWANSPFGGTA
jgi:hypothetical protein